MKFRRLNKKYARLLIQAFYFSLGRIRILKSSTGVDQPGKV